MRTFALLLCLCFALGAKAQQAKPWGSNSTELKTTIVSTGVYQQVFAASSNGARVGCLIINKGTTPTTGNTMLVFFGPTQPANNSGIGVPLSPPTTTVSGGAVSCGLIGGGVAVDAVWIEGTAGDTYEYSSQP